MEGKNSFHEKRGMAAPIGRSQYSALKNGGYLPDGQSGILVLRCPPEDKPPKIFLGGDAPNKKRCIPIVHLNTPTTASQQIQAEMHRVSEYTAQKRTLLGKRRIFTRW